MRPDEHYPTGLVLSRVWRKIARVVGCMLIYMSLIIVVDHCNARFNRRK